MQQGIPSLTGVSLEQQEEEDPAPHISVDLVEWFERHFPDVCPEPYLSPAELGRLFGQIECVKVMRIILTSQSEGKV